MFCIFFLFLNKTRDFALHACKYFAFCSRGGDECIKMLRRSRMLKLLRGEFCIQLQKERETVFGFVFPADLYRQHFTFLGVYWFNKYKNKTSSTIFCLDNAVFQKLHEITAKFWKMTRNSKQILIIAVVCDNPNFSSSSRKWKKKTSQPAKRKISP
jgi:hypothetical protein